MDVITTHINADFDALASMIAAHKLYPDAVMVFPGSQEKSIRDFMLQSTMYFLDIQKPSSISYDNISTVILVDIRQAGRIGPFAPVCRKKGVDIHVYDHHPSSPDDVRGTFELIEPLGSTTTLMCRLLKEKNIQLTPEEATVMMLGIYEDTGNLTFSSTTVEDFTAAGYLLSQGANLNVVADMVVKELTAEQVSMLNQLIENTCNYTIHGIDVLFARASSEHYIGDFAVLAHKLKNIENVNVLFAIANMEDRIHIVARSRIPEVNVGGIMAEFGGGGHATAGSATVHNMTGVQVEEKLISVLHDKISPPKTAGDIMNAPVKTIPVTETLDRASTILTRYNINVLPVEQEGRLAGLISRQIIEKAKHHGLKGVPVREYMSSEFAAVKPETHLQDIKYHIIHGNQRFLPVVSGEEITGCITRTDLLRVLHLDADEELGKMEQVQRTVQKKQMKSVLYERLPENILMLCRRIGAHANRMGYKAYAVGGFVRDILMRVPNYDIDIVVEGDGVAFARSFADSNNYQVKVFKKFGTAVITAEEGLKVDVATSRLEYYEKPAALPKVERSSIKHDLYRRDFTINTLAVRLCPRHFGQLLDYFGGRRDIKERAIRVLHNLSFVEDPSRIFRAVRFEQRYGFHLGKLTRKLVENAVKLDFLENLSGKRIFSETMLLLKEQDVPSVIARLNDINLLGYIHPRIVYDTALRNLLRSIEDVLSWYELLYLDNRCEKWFVFFLGLIDRLTEQEAQALCRKCDLKKSYAVPIQVAKTAGSDILMKMAHKRRLKNSDIFRLLRDIPDEVCLYIMAKTGRQSTKKAISSYFTKLRSVSLHVSGTELKELGIPPGKIYRKILDRLLDAVLDGKVQGKNEELKLAKDIFTKEVA